LWKGKDIFVVVLELLCVEVCPTQRLVL